MERGPGRVTDFTDTRGSRDKGATGLQLRQWNYGGRPDFILGPDGAINTPLRLWSGAMQITGTVQSIQVQNGTCGGGTVKMIKKS